MKPTLFAGFVTAISFALPAQAQETPVKTERKTITINVNSHDTKLEGDRKGTVKIIRNVNGKEEIIEREFSGEMPADLKEELNKFSPESIKEVHINKDGAKKNAEIRENRRVIVINSTSKDLHDANTLPAETQKMLAEKGITIDGNNAFHFKVDELSIAPQNGKSDFTYTYKLDDGKEVNVFISKICTIKIQDSKVDEQLAEGKTAEEPKVDNLTVYPNPSDGNFNLKFNLEQKGDAQVSLFDKEGNKIYEEMLKDFSGAYEKPLDLRGQKAGNYILKILQNGKLYTRQVFLK